ncbi:Patatin-like phospholipase/acyl hydrolase [Catalinimonas alkaloidigena]|uniref:Patatin-like phospholipase/acyl hydrolase n=1 Tax=Catalinimonas alkaloidigena TaxID=1075417 RepID=A0A1G9SH27_9BACT|nr:patatin-like phospholipase family protein [Catalinimonas alkaloidigena]SDM34630.1 Patatin-like phospholipase/acyl hydrolase [Catalinimonas alkaloidigena]
MSQTVNILSLDGGGTRGLFPATLLDCLRRDTGMPLSALFDVIVGSATGGIIAAALACGVDTAEIVDIYLNRAGFILPATRFRRLWNPLNLFAPKYPNANLKQLLTQKFGTTTLQDVAAQHGTRPAFLLAALDLSPDLAPDEPPAFRVEIYNSALTAHQDERMVNLALRTSAAAVNLPLHGRFSEGGNYANDPALIGLAFALNDKVAPSEGMSRLPGHRLGLGASLKDIRLFSLGCGSTGSSFVSRRKIGNGNWGLLKWTGHLVSLVIDTNMVAVQHYLREMLHPAHYYRLNPYYSAADAPAVLRNQALKIDVTDAAQLAAIHAYAEALYQQQKAAIYRFLDLS